MLFKAKRLPLSKKKACECAAELARNLIDDNGNNSWPELLKFLFDCASSNNPDFKESGLTIFSIVPGVFGNVQIQYVDTIKQMLMQCITDQQHYNVRVTGVKAASAFLMSNEKNTQVLLHFKDLLPPMLQVIVETVDQQDDDAPLKCLIDMSETLPKFVRPSLEAIVTLCLKIVSNSEMMEKWRHLALEVIVSLAESSPNAVRKLKQFMADLVSLLLMMMVDLEDDPDWSVSSELDDDDSDSNAIAGESALDRLACSLGGKVMLPLILANIPTMLSSDDWRYKHAALMAVSACGEGCHKQMEQMLSNIVEAILPFLNDSHPRVRFASCNAIGQMSADFGPTFQKKFHEKVVPGLLAVMDDERNPRVQAHAGAALVNFSEDCPKAIITPYLDAIMLKLEQVLSTRFKESIEGGTKLVLEQVVTTLASVADTAEEKFVHYYDRFIPSLKYIVQNATSTDLRLFRGKTIECISLIGLAVGKEKFMQDCSDVMQLLLKTQTEDPDDLPDDDPQSSYMISAWARMCKIMGKEFEQYLPLVMGPVLKAAALKPEVSLMDGDDMEAMENDADWQFVTLGDQQSFGIRTAGLEEKATACQMLVCYARELKDGFASYAGEVIKIMVPHLKFYFHDGVRLAAAESLPYLIECVKLRMPEHVPEMWQYMCPELFKAIDTEPEKDIQSEHLYSLAQCIEKIGQGCFNSEQLNTLSGIINRLLVEHFEHQDERQEKRKDEDYDEETEENLLEQDDDDVYVLSKISDIMHALFATYQAELLPFFNTVLPHFVKLISTGRPWADRQWAICIFDDLIEHCGPDSLNYSQYFLQPFVNSITDQQSEVRQASAYGFGVMAQFGGENYAQPLSNVLPSLVKVVSDPSSREVENVSATENAISAITKICKYNSSAINLDDVLPLWLSWLPVFEDAEEAVHIYTYFCDLIESNHPKILGEGNQNLPKIVAIIAEVIQKEVLLDSPELIQKMTDIVRQIKGNESIFQHCLALLPEEQRTALQHVIS